MPCTVSLNVPKFLTLLCLQGLLKIFNGCDYWAQSGALSFEKIFSSEMDKNDIYLGDASKQNTLFQKISPKNAIMHLISRIGPGLTFFGF